MTKTERTKLEKLERDAWNKLQESVKVNGSRHESTINLRGKWMGIKWQLMCYKEENKMTSRELELVRRREKEAWVQLRKASELYEMGDRRVLRLRARWSAISDILDELEEFERIENI
jgi:hypothetical protein